MAVGTCSGDCGRLISISVIPGGNPTALADPENWAVNYVHCELCRGYWCDRCHGQLGATATCPRDGGPLRETYVTGGQPAAPEPPPTPRERGKWWKPGRG